ANGEIRAARTHRPGRRHDRRRDLLLLARLVLRHRHGAAGGRRHRERGVHRFGVRVAMTLPIDVEAVRNATVVDDPFPYLMVPGFVKTDAIDGIERDFPRVTHAGSFPLPTLNFGPKFQEFMDAIRGPEFTAAVADKFGIDLSHRPTMVTVRGQSSARDGQIHTDSVT